MRNETLKRMVVEEEEETMIKEKGWRYHKMARVSRKKEGGFLYWIKARQSLAWEGRIRKKKRDQKLKKLKIKERSESECTLLNEAFGLVNFMSVWLWELCVWLYCLLVENFEGTFELNFNSHIHKSIKLLWTPHIFAAFFLYLSFSRHFFSFIFYTHTHP